jgi:peptidoglycan/LPS O-acetylase OafA/YrhL
MLISGSERPTNIPSTYLPSLDGWRALSIALVIMHHSSVSSTVPVFRPLLQSISDFGEIGVEIFFAISGLLICSRLLEEESSRGQISVQGFYRRRFFRILPAAFFYLLVVAILAAFHVIPLLTLDWFGALFFFRNYLTLLAYLRHSPLALHWYTGHFWSLSMEEHFYLVLPGILVLFKKTRLWVLGGLALAVALWRAILTHFFHTTAQFNFRTDTHVDALLIPAMIALALYPLMRNQAAKRYLPAWSFAVFAGLVICLLTIKVPFSFTLRAVVIPLLILSTVLHPTALPGRILELRPIRWVGWISYSLYLWQQLFFGVNVAGSPPRIAFLREWPINVLALTVCATFSYYVVEKPFVRLGHRFSLVPATRNASSAGASNSPPLPVSLSMLDQP